MLASRAYIFVAVAVASLAASLRARAAAPAVQMGERGQIVVSTSQTLPIVGYSHRASGGALIYGDDLDEPVYNSPRLVLDYVVARRFTIGSDLLASFTLGGVPKKEERPSVSLFGVAPHVGYILAPNSLVAFWPRAGITYYALTEENAAVSTTHRQLSLSLAAHLVITPFPHLGVTMGPTMDLPIAGKVATRDGVTGVSLESRATSFHVGFAAGLLVYF